MADVPDSARADRDAHRFSASLGDLATRYGLDATAVWRLGTLGALLVCDRLAPTTVRDPVRVRDDHLADALVALDLPQLRSARQIADLGAGAGVPGLPLAVALPGARVTLIEANGRKCAFMARAVELMALKNAEIVQARAEAWTLGLGQNDLVTARALAGLDVVAEYAAPLLKIGGVVVVWKGRRELAAEADAVRAAAVLGLRVHEPLQVMPYGAAEHRYLHVMSKIEETPTRFPRRVGVARKRPLGRA